MRFVHAWFRLFVLLGLFAATAGTGHATYTLEPAGFDGGGTSGSSTAYTGTFSLAPGASGRSADYALRSGFAGQLVDPPAPQDIRFLPPASFASDGAPKVFIALADFVDSFTYSYAGRAFTSYGPSPEAPIAVGLYAVTATPADAGPSSTARLEFTITGPLPAADDLTKSGAVYPIIIESAELLANDIRLQANGELTPDSLSITGVTTDPGNTVALGTGDLAGKILFTPSTTPSSSFVYTVSDGLSTATALVTVTIIDNPGPTLSLEITSFGTAAFDGTATRSTFGFLGTPAQTYHLEFSTDLANWTAAQPAAADADGAFVVQLVQVGNYAAAWDTRLFFRLKR